MGKLYINFKALADNYRTLQARIGSGCVVGAAVKANGYGLGAVEVSRALYDAGCRQFFVATLEEGVELRAALPDDTYIACLNGLTQGREVDYTAANLTPVLGSLDEIKRWQEYALDKPAILHFDTGMNRHGLPEDEAQALLNSPDLLSALNVQVIMSHFACADELDHEMNHMQYQKFMDIAAHFPHAKKSLCNSSGIFLNADYHLDVVRAGMALYGLNPTPYTNSPMRPVVRLEAPIIQLKVADNQSTSGYNATYRFGGKSRLAIIDIGYADGLPRSLSNKGAFYVGGVRCPIRGRISMDLTIIDMSAVAESYEPRIGEMVEVIGVHQSVDDLAHDAGIIGYEILTSLGARHERIYVEDESP